MSTTTIPQEQGFVSTLEAAKILELGPDAIRAMARSGRLPTAISTRAGRLYRLVDVVRLKIAREQVPHHAE
jgi:hypothetical protein